MKLVCSSISSNWDLYSDENDYLWAVPNQRGILSGNKFSHFGNRDHIKYLMSNNFFNVSDYTFTEEGVELFSGLFSRFIFNDDMSIKFSILSFK